MTPATAPLLIELLTEELPPKTLLRLSDTFASILTQRLAELDLIEGSQCYTPYATPRRLAVLIENVRYQAPDQHVREKIMPVSIALDAHGHPTTALTKKLAALGLSEIAIESLERAGHGPQEMFFFTHRRPGQALAHSLQSACENTLAQLPIAKKMSYQRTDGGTIQFVRPAHRLVALWGSEVMPIQLLGLSANRITMGHRFLSEDSITLQHATQYAPLLQEIGHVIASYSERRERIHQQLLAAAGDDQVILPDALLDEVTSLVEWPTVYTCQFDPDFLCIPPECLILTMQTHQKYFALTDTKGQLQPRFLVVSNISTPHPENIIEGNERVIRPRLADARFFFEQDQKIPLADYMPRLANVLYHHKLGSQLMRSARLENIAAEIASALGVDSAQAGRAAWLAKADLTTAMVGEFPELQGTMGQYYAQHSGESEPITRACFEHYQPRFSGDALPSPGISTAVALADKLEILMSMWSIGIIPTGEKDPFALRRQALGILRIIIEQHLDLNLEPLLRFCFAQLTVSGAIEPTLAYTVSMPAAQNATGALPVSSAAPLPADTPDPTPAVLLFFLERLRVMLRDQGHTTQAIDAVFAKIRWVQADTVANTIEARPENQDPAQQNTAIEGLPCTDLLARLKAVQAFSALPQALALAAANKRITNILKKSPNTAAAVQTTLLELPAERALFEQLNALIPQAAAHIDARRYTEALLVWTPLHAPVDAFFDTVHIQVENAALRANRLALLTLLHENMNAVAELAKLAQ